MSIRSLPRELQEKAKHELNELPEQIYQNINSIKAWLKENPELNARTGDQWILSFLRGCKFNLEKTKEKLEFFYTLRATTPDFFANRDPLLPEIQDILNRGILLFLPNVNPAGPPILMVRWEKVDPAQVLFKNLIKVALMCLDIVINENDSFVVAGQQILQDFQGFSVRYLTQMTPGICRKCILCLQTAYPTRIKGVHFINVPIYFKIIYNIVNPFLNKKLRSRVSVYGEPGVSTLSDDIPLPVLPNEYGGEGGFVDDLADEWKTKVESYRDWFLKEDS